MDTTVKERVATGGAASAADPTITKVVRERYQRIAEEGSSCCASSCCGADEAATGGTSTDEAAEIGRSIGYTEDELASLPAEANLGLGCGNPTGIASLQPGDTVLDLGSGAGIDCFLAARQVGPTGRVIGVDMTPAMLERARSNARTGGFDNVEFRLGEIEALPVADGSIDVIISNCVLNLVPDKERAFREIYRVLRPGGRIVISDMVSDIEPPADLRANPDAIAACLPVGRDRYLGQLREAGFSDARITSEHRYPAEHILGDAGVTAWLAQHPNLREEVERLAEGIYGAHFEATRP